MAVTVTMVTTRKAHMAGNLSMPVLIVLGPVCKLPLYLANWAHIFSCEPCADAMPVEGMIACPDSHVAWSFLPLREAVNAQFSVWFFANATVDSNISVLP